MIRHIVSYLAHFHGGDHSLIKKMVSLLGGGIFFLILLPMLFIWIGSFLEKVVPIDINRYIEYALSLFTLAFGLSTLIWTTVYQWKTGEGTPAPNAPTKHLLTSGPYRLCRNPIELGAIFYYFGLGTLCSEIITGITCFILGLIVGSSYHKFIEEKELEIRFGDEYKAYKKVTPFLFPVFFKKIISYINRNYFIISSFILIIPTI